MANSQELSAYPRLDKFNARVSSFQFFVEIQKLI